jgi:tetratricopeptide (TPR) repeat protein
VLDERASTIANEAYLETLTRIPHKAMPDSSTNRPSHSSCDPQHEQKDSSENVELSAPVSEAKATEKMSATDTPLAEVVTPITEIERFKGWERSSTVRRVATSSCRLFAHIARLSFHGLDNIQKVMIAVGVIAVVALGGAYACRGWRSVTLINPITIPDDLVKEGFSSTTMQRQFTENLLSILDSASSVMPTEIHSAIQESGQQEVHLEIPGTGISLQDTMTAAKSMFQRDGHITAEIVRDGKALRLSGRVTRPGGESHEFHAESLSGNVQQVTWEAAKAAMNTYSPYVLASSILDQAQKECEQRRACEYTDAANAYDEVLRSDSADDKRVLAKWAHLGLSKIAENKFDYLTEIEHTRDAIMLDPNFSWARYNWGVALEKMGCSAEALVKFSEVTRDRDSFAAGHNALGRQYLQVAERLPQPVTSDRLRMPPQANPARLAEEQFEAATVLDPRYAEAFINLGEALKIQGKPQEALEKLRKAIVVDREHAGRAYAQIAAIDERLGDTEMASSARQEAIASDGQNAWCSGNPEADDSTLHGCSKAQLKRAVQTSIHNVADWPDTRFAPEDCKKYANENGP